MNLRQPPFPAVTGKYAAYIEAGCDGLDTLRAGDALAFKEQAINEPDRFRVERVDRTRMRYRSVRPDDAGLPEAMKAVAGKGRRFGYRRGSMSC